MTIPEPMSVRDLVAMLKAAGYAEMSAQKVNKDIAEGAPVDAHGRVDVLEYGAWLARFV